LKWKEVLDIAHMTPFLRSAILFQPYDAKRQDLLERKERAQVEQARKAAAARAASGQTQEDVMDISEDGFKGETTSTAPAGDAPQTNSELGMLQRGESADLSEMFKTNTAAKRSHPMYEFISLVRIEPSERVLTFKMILPPSATEPDLTTDKLQRIKHGVYQVFQALVVEPWLKPYLEYVASVRTSCARVKKDEFDMTREFPIMTVEMTTANVKQNRGRPFNSAEFEKIATVIMEG
jgi:hypothetical protein